MKLTRVPVSTSICVIMSVIIFFLYIGWGPNSQYYNLNKLEKWKIDTGQSFEKLLYDNPELKNVKIGCYTGGLGMLEISIDDNIGLGSKCAFYEWLVKNNPPRPILFREHKAK